MNIERRRNPSTAISLRPHDLLHAVLARPWRWAVPLVLCVTLGTLYAFFKPAVWEATQALLVRDEAVGKSTRPGRFSAVEEMKTAQETVMELIKSRIVLANALKQVGPPADQPAPQDWPSDRTTESLEDAIKIVPPKGAEFGKTEVFYLKVQAGDRARAIALAEAICYQLEVQCDDLRYQKYQGIIDELTKTVSLAQADLDTSTAELTAVEREAGPDLAELRILNESPSNESGLRRMAGEIETELRTYRASVASNQELLKLLQASIDDPGRLLASPGRLLESQPALRRLKDGLVDAQLRTAALLGNMAEDHPAVLAAEASEQEISQHLHREISIAVKGLEVDLRLANERVERLEEQRKNVQDRLVHLATIRAQYSNLAATTRQRGDVLKTAQQELAEARAGQAAARAASLITLVGQANVGSRPVGPGKTIILLASLVGGLAVGAGIVFLTIEPISLAKEIPAEALAQSPAARTWAIPTPGIEALPTEPMVPKLTPAESAPAAPAAAGYSAGRPPETRTGGVRAPAPPMQRESAAPSREKKADTLIATAARPTRSAPLEPVAAGSLSLRQALDRVFPEAMAHH
jgi:polysaccharide biosynthesis transport protein